MLFSHPHNGYPDACPEELPAECELLLFQKMREFSSQLDRFDKRVISFQCDNYHEWHGRADEELDRSLPNPPIDMLFPRNRVNSVLFFRILTMPAIHVIGMWSGLCWASSTG